MSDPNSTSNVKIYDRPERKGPSPLLLVVALLVVLLLALGAYKVMHKSDAPTQTENTRSTSTATSAANP